MRLVSIIVPLYNEEDNVQYLYDELCSVAAKLEDNVEFIFVNDGSRDKTLERMREITATDNRVTIVEFRRNFGQTAAMAAGFDYASGDIVALLDGDLQNDPAELPRMIAKLDEGYDMVAGWRKNRQDAFISRKIPSMLANRLISRITNVRLHDYGCSLKVMRGEVAKNINLYGEMHRFIPALAEEMGIKLAEMPVNHRPRLYGTSKYGISRTFRVILDLLTVKFFLGYSKRPIHLFGFLGLISGFIGTLLMVMMVLQRFIYALPMGNRPLLALAVMMIMIGLQFLCFGLLAEVSVRTYHESQDKKIYSVRNVFRGGLNTEDRPKKVVGC
ncbi:MAG: glycosyltransferase family 2 protein [Deltaproteobacteria bacterium]|nr:glycosyltransferase family 2 protein [Deltaproteobacteria bacterium]